MGPPTLFTIPVLRYMKTYGITEEELAMVAVVQRDWAAKNPRATFKDPVTVEDVLGSRMIAYPFRLLMCCLVTDGGGALILTTADRATLDTEFQALVTEIGRVASQTAFNGVNLLDGSATSETRVLLPFRKLAPFKPRSICWAATS